MGTKTNAKTNAREGPNEGWGRRRQTTTKCHIHAFCPLPGAFANLVIFSMLVCRRDCICSRNRIRKYLCVGAVTFIIYPAKFQQSNQMRFNEARAIFAQKFVPFGCVETTRRFACHRAIYETRAAEERRKSDSRTTETTKWATES